MKLSEKLFELRKKADLSQEELAEKLDVSRQAVSKWESGAAQPELPKLIELSKLFRISMDELLSLEHAEPSEASEASVPSEPPKKRRRYALLCAALALLFLLYTNHRFSLLNAQIDSLRSQMSYLQSDIARQINTISGSVQSALKEESSPILRYDAEITDVDLFAETCTVRFTLLPKVLTDELSISLRLSGNDLERLIVLERDEFGAYCATTTLPLVDEICATAQFSSQDRQELYALSPLRGARSCAYPTLLSFSLPWSISGAAEGKATFSSTVVKQPNGVATLLLGALADRTVTAAYVDVVANGESVGRIPLTAERRASDAEETSFAPPSGASHFQLSGSGYALSLSGSDYTFYLADSVSLTLPRDSTVELVLVAELSDGLALRTLTERLALQASPSQGVDAVQIFDYQTEIVR